MSQLNQRLKGRPSWKWWACFFGFAGICIRLVLAWNSRGTNDIITWEYFAQAASQHGVPWMYRNIDGWNHPPLTGYLAAVLWHISQWLSLPFRFTFKLVPIAADAGSMFLLWKIWSRRFSPKAGSLAVLLFASNLNAVLVSAYHGNNDSLVGALILLACYLGQDVGTLFGSGLALAAAINVKLIPLILVPILFAHARRPSECLRTASGFFLGMLPFIPVLWMAGSSFYSNAIAYNSTFDNWGFPFFIRLTEQNPHWQTLAVQVQGSFVHFGRYFILAAIIAVCAWSRLKSHFSLYTLGAVGIALFLFLTPGFGVQYTAILNPVLFAVSLRWGVCYGLASGTFLASVYYLFWTREPLLHSQFTAVFPMPSPWIGLIAWMILLGFIITTLRTSEKESLQK